MVILYDEGHISGVPEAMEQEKFFLQEIDPGNGLVLYFGGSPSHTGSKKLDFSRWVPKQQKT